MLGHLALNAGYTYTDEGQTNKQDSGSWVYKAEWNGTVIDKLYLEARFGDFGYYFPLLTNGTENFWFRDTTNLTLSGSQQRWQLDRGRPVARGRGHLGWIGSHR